MCPDWWKGEELIYNDYKVGLEHRIAPEEQWQCPLLTPHLLHLQPLVGPGGDLDPPLGPAQEVPLLALALRYHSFLNNSSLEDTHSETILFLWTLG